MSRVGLGNDGEGWDDEDEGGEVNKDIKLMGGAYPRRKLRSNAVHPRLSLQSFNRSSECICALEL